MQPEFAAFPPWSGPTEAEFYYDFLGVRTRLRYLWLPDWVSGHTFGHPESEKHFLHSHAEWLGTLRAVLEAKDKLVAIELGAGWGPWLVAAYRAALARGLVNIKCVGIEGMIEHVEMLRQHCDDNGLTPENRVLIHGIVGVEDGTAYFPVSSDPRADWGAQAAFDDTQPPNTTAVRCISLRTLLSWFDRVDLIHCDIQGAEVNVVPAAMNDLNRKVRRVVIGTHSHDIDRTLIEAFRAAGWQDEALVPGPLNEHGYHEDGTQVWRNPRV